MDFLGGQVNLVCSGRRIISERAEGTKIDKSHEAIGVVVPYFCHRFDLWLFGREVCRVADDCEFEGCYGDGQLGRPRMSVY